MEFTEFDIIAIGLVLFLSIKGFINGFGKEFFSILGVIGGIFIATRINIDVGNFISNELFLIEKKETLRLIGFIIVFILSLILSSLLSLIFLSSSNEDGIIFTNRVLGYILSIIKYMLIFSMIIVGIKSSTFLDKKLKKYYQDAEIISYLEDAGYYLLNMKLLVDTDSGNTRENNSLPQDNIIDNDEMVYDIEEEKIIIDKEENKTVKVKKEKENLGDILMEIGKDIRGEEEVYKDKL